MHPSQPDLFQGLTESQVRETMALGSRKKLASGEVLFALGDPAGCLYLIERGRIRLTLPMTIQGHEEEMLVEERGAGQTIGWSALIPPYRFTLKAAALLESEVVAFPRTALMEHFQQNPSLGYAVLLNLATVIGHRLQLFQAMWLRQMQQLVEMRCA